MKTKALVVFGIFTFLNELFPREIYQSIRVYEPTIESIEIIERLGIPLDHVKVKKDVYIELTVTEDQTNALLDEGLLADILIADLTEYYQSRNRPSMNRDFPLGSMQGNYTWDELNARFDELQNTYPDIISERIIIGQSVEERDIWTFKVSDYPNNDEDEPKVLYTALTHAREPLSMMNLFYFVQYLSENYGTNAEVTYLVNNREMWFLPVINPDGYVYNQIIEPQGGGMHRKNRFDTNCGDGTERGVDLNRNYGYGWGSDNIGSSEDLCSIIYRGASEFSEPETQAVRDFISGHDFKNVLHYHSFSNIYIHPWGNGTIPDEPDLTTITEIGKEMARYNGYAVGNGLTTIGYTVNGDAVDWTYGSQNILSYTPEIGTPNQGFWPSEDEIIELCIDQLYPNKIFSFVAGSDIVLHSYELSQEYMMPGDDIEIQIVIHNRGLGNTNSDIEINIFAINEFLSIESDSFIINEIYARDYDDITFPISFNNNIPLGSTTGLIIFIENQESFSRTDTIEFVVGQRQVVFYDGFENGLSNWSLNGDWGLTNDALNGMYALSDSPQGEYNENQETIAELSQSLNLNYLSSPIVKFSAKWDIESNWDFVRFQAYIPQLGWVSLAGEYTQLGSGQSVQPFGEHGYDGLQDDWIEETVYLDQLNHRRITGFRFVQNSDDYVEGGGFTLDEFSLLGISAIVMGDYNMDSFVDIFDLLGLSDLLLSGADPSSDQLLLCDLDENGTLNISDFITLSNIIMGI